MNKVVENRFTSFQRQNIVEHRDEQAIENVVAVDHDDVAVG